MNRHHVELAGLAEFERGIALGALEGPLVPVFAHVLLQI